MQFKGFHLAAAGIMLCAAAEAGPTSPAASAPLLHGLRAYPVAPEARARAQTVAQQGLPVDELAAGAPARYTVKRGDTLWALAGMYLRKPWNWPALWGMNMERIRNPHWIFPGQVLVLTVTDGRATLAVDADQGIPQVRIEPGVRTESLPPAGIPTLDPQVIGAFLTRPLIVEPEQLAKSPRIVAVPDGHVMLIPGERAYVRGNMGDATHFDVYRPGRPLRDPGTGKIIAYQSDDLGSVDIVRGPQGKDQVSTVNVRTVLREMGVGDRLVAEPPRQDLDFTPKAPTRPMHGLVVTIGDDEHRMAGRNSVVALDLGQDDGLARGDVLAIERPPRSVADKTQKGDPTIALPERRIGLLMVFRTFGHVSYGLVLEADAPIEVADGVRQP